MFFLEKIGRLSPHDGFDLVGILAILLLLRITAVLPSSFVPWRDRFVAWGKSKFNTGKEQLRHNVGIDLRGDSVGASRSVPAFRTVSTLGWLLLGLAVVGHNFFPEIARNVLLQGSATVYFVLLGTLWTGLLFGITVGLVVAFILIHDLLVRRSWGGDSRGRKRLTLLLTTLYLVTVLGTGYFAGYPFGLILGFAGLACAHLFPKRPEGKPLIALVKNQQGEVFSVPFTSFVRQANTWVCLTILILGILAGGGRYPGDSNSEFTLGLGAAFLWINAPLLLVVLLRGLHLFWGQPLLSSPSGTRLKTVWILAQESDLERANIDVEALKRRLRVAEWTVVISPNQPDDDDADLALRLTEDPRLQPSTPLPGEIPVIQVRAEEFSDVRFAQKLDRWDHVWKRRRLYRRLRRLFKVAAGRSYQKGSGFLFAPHYWFVNGLTRDEDEEGLSFEDTSDGCIGPPYRKLFGVRLRRYLRELFESLEVDLIYIEDGVGYRGLKRVLGVLFEIYDIHGGKMRAEDRHFIGLPGLTVHLDDFGLDRDRTSLSGYPEPEYEGIGRARVLVIQKDRGGQDEEEDAPPPVDEEEDWNWLKDALQGITPVGSGLSV